MNLKNRLNIITGFLVFSFLLLGRVYAEGTHELSPTAADSAMLHTNAGGFGNFASFASFNTTSALNVRIKNFTTDSLYIGLSAEADDFGNLNSSYMFRILDPTGAVAFGPFTIGLANDNASTWALAFNGPDVNGAGGYSTNTALFPYSRFKPTMNGDYVIQFDDGTVGNPAPGNIVNILWYDFTVRSGGVVQPGRLWSRNWALRTPPRMANTPPECQFDRPFNGVFYSYTIDGFVSRIDFANSGFQGLSFTVAFGDRGPGTTGDVMTDRRSVKGMNATGSAAQHQVFLNDPDNMEFPSSPSQCGAVTLFSVDCIAADTFCINVGVTRPGQVEVILDFNNNGIYDPDSEDVILAMFFEDADTLCIPWNGVKGDGTQIPFGESIPTVLKYFQGVQHYAAFDVEFLKFGFCVQTIRPICSGLATNLLYWDDTNITDDVATVTIDEGDPGTGQPKFQFNGCTCHVDGCRTWDNFQIGDPPTGTCVGTPFGYGDNNTLNTWWFASTITIEDIFLPFLQVNITGDSAICNGDSTVFIANVFPDTIVVNYSWEGPNGFTATTPTTGFISDAGTYYVTITDPNTDCNAIDSLTLIVYDTPTTTISFTCNGPNQSTADINLTVSGGLAPYMFLWSNGATTEDLQDVGPGQYSVIVTDAHGCMAFDTILVQGCCQLIVICPSTNGGTFACLSNVPAPNNAIVQVTNSCDGFTITNSQTTNGGTGCPGSPIIITRVYTVQDNAGNTQSCTQTITVVDNAAPVITCPANLTIQCTASTLPANTGTATATDNCDTTPTISSSDVTVGGVCAQERTITRTWTATDDCGNVSTCMQTIFVDDSAPPSITCPANITLAGCNAAVPAPNTSLVTASDNCSVPVVTFVSDVVNLVGCTETTTRTYRAADGCGNSSTCTQTITRTVDTTPPTITCPANVTLSGCNGAVPPPTPGTVVATDACGTPTVVFVIDVIVLVGCTETTTRTYRATDACSNSSTCTQTIVRTVDAAPPTITCPANITIACTSGTLPATTGTATASDNCTGTPTVTFSDVITGGACPVLTLITRTWVATDGCGSTSSCVQTITISDTTAPTLVCPANVTIECTASTLPANTGSPTASDNCDATLTLTFSDVTVGGACPQERTITRTWFATDDCGNSGTCVQTIFVDDSTPPAITCPANTTIQCTASTLPANTGTATATDNCDATLAFTFTDVTVGGACPQERTITRTWRATDDCGNSSSCTQVIVVDDSVAPAITCPANITILCTASTLPTNTGTATATDNCDATPTLTFSNVTVAGSCIQERTITRTWVATDACGNSSSCTQTIFVDDNLAPTITCPANVTIQCTASTLPANTGTATATDNCTGTPSLTFNDVTVTGACPLLLVVTRTWMAADGCGNTSTCVQTVSVIDNTAPVITCPANTTIQCNTSTLPAATGTATAVDICDATPTITFSNLVVAGSCPQQMTITRTWVASDDCNNSSSCTQVITVVDQTPPVAVCQDLTIDFAGGTMVTLTPGQLDGGSSDNCGAPVTLAISQTIFNCVDFIQVGTIPVTLTVTDACGNTSTCIAQVSGVGGALTIDCPDDIIIYLGPGECVAYVNYLVTADAICGGAPVIIQTDNSGLTSGDAFPIGTTIQTYIATNGADTATCSFNITVIEYDIPVVMACNDTVNVSVDQNCEAHIFVDMILEGDAYGCYNGFIISIDSIGSDTGWIVFDATEFIGGCYTVTITDIETGNSCWGVACIEDKIAPQILCACPPGSDGGDTCQISCLQVQQLADGNIPPELYPTVIENCGYTLEIANIDVNDLGCSEGTVIVSWLVTDLAGHTATCDQEFQILPLSVDSLICPPNYVGPCGSSSDPDVTGWPSIGGIELDDDAGLCNLFIGYWDKPLQDCGAGQKILRTFTILDWCTQELTECQQVIKLSDTEGPVLTCPDDLTVGTDFWYCTASLSIPKPIAFDDCSDVVNFDLIAADGTIVIYGNNFVIQGLALGTHDLTWIVTDLCGNSSSCSFTLTVEDDVAPVANCDEHTIVGLTNDGPLGITLVPASVFDDGSYDNCGPVTFRARRMDSCIDYDWTTNGACIDDIPNGQVNSADRGTSLKPCVPFACCDVPHSGSRAAPIMVELEVTDAAGNKNYCMVEVEVQDKLSPFIVCPPDIYVSCDFWFPAEDGIYRDVTGNQNGHLDEDPLSDLFGDMYDALTFNDDESVRQPIIINDPGNTEYPQPHVWGIDGWADDNCFADLEVRVKVYNDCSGENLPGNPPPGAVKLIERRFTARDNQEGFNPASCTQRIWVVDFDPFYISDTDCFNNDPFDGVKWPCDVIINNCPDDFSNTGEPLIQSDACSLIGVTYEDTRFEIADGACYKILREWKVIDWCQYNSGSGYGLWKYTQVIKVHDDEAPVFLDCPQGPVTLCVADPGVRLPANNQAFLGEENPSSSSCSVQVTLTHRIREACNGLVHYDVKYYPFNGNSYLQVVPLTTVTLDANHEADLVFNTEESAIQTIRQNGLPYNSKWCGDYHRVLWSVEDGCGNWAHCEYLLRLEDCKQPSPVCIQGLSTVIMPIGCQVTLWAKDFNASSFDDCTASENLIYSFSGDSYEPSRTFNQTNIAAYGVELSIPIWVADEGTDDNCNSVISWNERNSDYCTTTVVFTDNSGNCDQSGSVLYDGEIRTYNDDPVEAVNVSLHHNTEIVYAMTTADNGKYVLVVPQVDNQRYDIVPERLDEPRNGVSTLDLVRIQKHLLGIEEFDSPFQYIAADANNNEQISAIDLIEIRKLILGIYPAYPNNKSWRFVEKGYQFADATHPWPFNEVINLQYEGHSVSNLDFVGVKVGDVNNSVKANATAVKPRGGDRIMTVKASAEQQVVAGQVVEVEFTLPEAVDGFQWTWETPGLEFTGIESEDNIINDQHIGIPAHGLVTMSWNKPDFTATVKASAHSFTMKFVATSAGTLSDMIRMTNRIAHAEAYTSAEEILEVRLAFDQLAATREFALYQNEPNPWNGSTTVSFDLPEASKIKLSLFDLTGQLIKVIEGDFKAGRQSILIQKKDIQALGILYYRLDSGNYSATKKMIRIE